jgi:hypothetical protein
MVVTSEAKLLFVHGLPRAPWWGSQIPSWLPLIGRWTSDFMTVQDLTLNVRHSTEPYHKGWSYHRHGGGLIPTFPLEQSSAPQSYWNDRPGVALVVPAGTPEIYFTAVNGHLSTLYAGSVYWTMCEDLTP